MCLEPVKTKMPPSVWILLLQPVLFDNNITSKGEEDFRSYLAQTNYFKGITEDQGLNNFSKDHTVDQ